MGNPIRPRCSPPALFGWSAQPARRGPLPRGPGADHYQFIRKGRIRGRPSFHGRMIAGRPRREQCREGSAARYRDRRARSPTEHSAPRRSRGTPDSRRSPGKASRRGRSPGSRRVPRCRSHRTRHGDSGDVAGRDTNLNYAIMVESTARADESPVARSSTTVMSSTGRSFRSRPDRGPPD
jgi:hypothetical protein